MKEIVQVGNDVLRKKAEKVLVSDITSEKIQNILENMKKALSSQDDGVAIAAPQIGVSLTIFVVSNKVLKDDTNTNTEDKVYVNPKIIKRSRKKTIMEEGCLSVRGLFGKIKRHEKVTLEAYDESGTKFSQGASGLLAQIFQHETDHLEGKLFIDEAQHLIEA